MAKPFTVALFTVLIALARSNASPAQEASTLGSCSRDEEVILTCTIGVKTMSLCKAGADVVHYRFGKRGRAPELVYPEDSRRATDAFFWDAASYAKGSSQYVTFRNGDYVYIVYHVRKAFSAVEGDAGAGVFVMRNGLLSANLRCAEQYPAQKLHETFSKLGLARSPFGIPPNPYDEPLSLPLFEGEWEGTLCPEGNGIAPEGCSRFTISLFERPGQLCGVHSFATADGGRMDDGVPPSIVGSITANKAEIVVTSGRAPESLRVSLERYADGHVDNLRWKALEPNTTNDTLLPVNVSLTRSKTPTFTPEYSSSAREACKVAASR